jgi:hypothetical protein
MLVILSPFSFDGDDDVDESLFDYSVGEFADCP